MLRNDVPPPAPAVTPSMSRPASLNMPFSSATAHGSVATRRPYWLTVIFAAKAEVMWHVTGNAMTAAASAIWNRMLLPPLTCALIARVVVSARLVHQAFGDLQGRAKRPSVRNIEQHKE